MHSEQLRNFQKRRTVTTSGLTRAGDLLMAVQLAVVDASSGQEECRLSGAPSLVSFGIINHTRPKAKFAMALGGFDPRGMAEQRQRGLLPIYSRLGMPYTRRHRSCTRPEAG